MRQVNNRNRQPAPCPLYIETEIPARLTLEGPAVAIAMKDSEPRYIPLRRISRIHVSRQVDIDTDVLLECAERGIILILQDTGGNTIARMVGNASAMTTFRQRLVDITTRPDWRSLYQTWRYAQQRRIGALLVHRMHAPARLRSQPEQTMQWFQQQIENLAGINTAEQTRKLFNEVCLAWSQEHLLHRGVGAENELWLTGKPDLAADIASLLSFRIETIRLGWIRGICKKHPKHKVYKHLHHKSVITKLEQQHSRINRLGIDLVNRLHCWLVEMS